MSTGYTETQLQECRDEAIRLASAHPTHADLKTAPELRRVAMAGTEVGALVRMALKNQSKTLIFFLNPVIALLMIALNQAGMNFKWWSEPQPSDAKPLPDLERHDLEKAKRVVSITTASEPNGLLVRFAGGGTFTFYIPRRFAAEIVTVLNGIGETATWWDQDFRLLPKPN
jgi:hypothetical protein